MGGWLEACLPVASGSLPVISRPHVSFLQTKDGTETAMIQRIVT
eukprot:COSAG01_NODE_788_length_13597_cov_35.303601_10_plen_44_part_00